MLCAEIGSKRDRDRKVQTIMAAQWVFSRFFVHPFKITLRGWVNLLVLINFPADEELFAENLKFSFSYISNFGNFCAPR